MDAVCVTCHQPRATHHAKGWCFWLSDEEHLPFQYSETEPSPIVLVLVDEAGIPLEPSAGARDVADAVEE